MSVIEEESLIFNGAYACGPERTVLSLQSSDDDDADYFMPSFQARVVCPCKKYHLTVIIICLVYHQTYFSLSPAPGQVSSRPQQTEKLHSRQT